MNRLRRSLFFIILLIFSSSLTVEELAGGKGKPDSTNTNSELNAIWTISGAIERALSVNPDIQLADALMERQRGLKVQVRGDLLPTMRLIGSANGRDEELIDRNPDELSQVPSEQTAITQDAYSGSVEFRQVVFDGFKRLNRFQQESLIYKGTKANSVDTERKIISYVKQAFDQLLFTISVVDIRRKTVATYENVLEIAQKKKAAGDVTAYEILRVRSELQSAIAELAESESNVIKAEQFFRRLLVLPQSTDPLKDRVKLNGELENLSFDLSFGKSLGLALANRGDLHAARYQLEAAKKGVNAANGEWLPMIEVFANYSLRSSYFDENTELQGWTIGAVGQWNIFDGFKRGGTIVFQKAEARAAQIRYQQLEYRITSHIQELYAQISQYRSVINYHRISMDLGNESLQQAERLYEVGQVGLEKVLDAQITLSRSQINLSRSLFDYNIAISQIEYAIATPLNSSNSDENSVAP